MHNVRKMSREFAAWNALITIKAFEEYLKSSQKTDLGHIIVNLYENIQAVFPTTDKNCRSDIPTTKYSEGDP